MIDEALFSSESTEWITPHWLFNALDKEFKFDLDPAATDETAKCDLYFTKDDDGLVQEWYVRDEVDSVFVNPPYGRAISDWVAKAYLESQRGATIVLLLPARTDVAWFHDYILGKAEIRFLRGRLKFLIHTQDIPFKETNPAPFPSMIVVFRPSHARGVR
jgi:site-specific DNA-methyltransferase (adenine-specific)